METKRPVQDEITEELLEKEAPAAAVPESLKTNKKKRKILIIIFVLAAAALAGWFAFSAWQNAQYDKQLDLAQKYMDDGNYEDAILAYDAAISIADNRQDAYEGKALASINSGDIATAKQMYQKLYDITGSDSYKQMESTAGLGNSSANYANGGIVTSYGDTVYVANMPSVGCISQIKDGDTRTVLDLSAETRKVGNLSTDGTNLYYYVSRSDNLFSGDGYKIGIYKVPVDGGEETLLQEIHRSIGVMNLLYMQGKLYMLISSEDYYTTILTIDPNTGETAQFAQNRFSQINSDGQYLYAVLNNSLDSEAVRMDSSGNITVLYSTQSASLRNLQFSGTRLYLAYAGNKGGGWDICSMNNDGSDVQMPDPGTMMYNSMNVDNKEIYMGGYYDSDNNPTNNPNKTSQVDIEAVDLNGQQVGDLIEFDLGDVLSDSSVSVGSFADLCLENDRLYYQIIYSKSGSSTCYCWGSIKTDGTDNQIYSHT